MAPSQTSDQLVADRYDLVSPLGRGGMGVVWRADDTLLKRQVAVKEVDLPSSIATEECEAIRKRVLREARAAARLNHPNAVTVYDVVEADGKAFIVMEMIHGRTLAEVVHDEGPMSPEKAAEVGLAVLGALEAAHKEGIVHRDVKPANVMIAPDGRVKLADFGIASVKDDPKITASGLILGSPSYMAPEQANHGTSGPEADLWGLGTTLYFAVEGVPPFEREGAIPTLTAVLGDEPRPMEHAGSLAPIIEALLQKDPTRRADESRTHRELGYAAAGGSIRTADLPSTQEVEAEPAPRTAPLPAEPVHETTPEPRRATKTVVPVATPDRKWVVALLALLALAAAAIFLIPGLLDDDGNEPTRADGGRRDRAEAPAPAEDEAEDDDAVAAEDVSAPADSETYEDPTLGYTLSYPSGWTVDGEGSKNTFFRDPGTGTYLQVAWAQPPTADTPEEAWESYAPTFAARHEGYEEIGITPTTFKGMDAAAWEFTYVDGGTRLRAVDLGFITEDGSTGMALYFQAPEENWDEAEELFEQLKAGFEPPA